MASPRDYVELRARGFGVPAPFPVLHEAFPEMMTVEAARTALIVDDEDQLRRLMSRVLSKAGIRTLLAESASEARALFETYESEIDLLLLDVTLRDGDGAEQLLPEFVARKPAAIAIVTSGDEPPTALAEELKLSLIHI